MSTVLNHSDYSGWFPFFIDTPATVAADFSLANSNLVGPIPIEKIVEWYWKVKSWTIGGSVSIGSLGATFHITDTGADPPVDLGTTTNTLSAATFAVPSAPSGFNSPPLDGSSTLYTPQERAVYGNGAGSGVNNAFWGGDTPNSVALSMFEAVSSGPVVYRDAGGNYYLSMTLACTFQAVLTLTGNAGSQYDFAPLDPSTSFYQINLVSPAPISGGLGPPITDGVPANNQVASATFEVDGVTLPAAFVLGPLYAGTWDVGDTFVGSSYAVYPTCSGVISFTPTYW